MKYKRKMEDLYFALSVLNVLFIFMAFILKQISYDSLSCLYVFIASAFVALASIVLDIILKKSCDAIFMHLCILVICIFNLI